MGRLTKVSLHNKGFPEGQEEARGTTATLHLRSRILLLALGHGSSRKNSYLTFYFSISSS